MKYYLIAGEASGDLHGSNLMKGLYNKDPEADMRFWGGSLMNAVFKEHQKGEGLVKDYNEGAVMGFSQVILHLFSFASTLKDCISDIESFHPDVVILIDYPGFNFRVAEAAHKKGYKVFYYIAPKVWASRESRIKKIKKFVDRLFIVFPFEKQYFDSKGIEYIYKGNPLIDAIDSSEGMSISREEFLSRNSLPDNPYIAILAGSRKGEVSSMMPTCAAFIKEFSSIPQYSRYRFIIAGAPSRSMEDYSPYLEGIEDKVKVIFGFGVNDLGNVSRYISYFNDLIKAYPQAKIYILSVNPIVESKWKSKYVSNKGIRNFNDKIFKAFKSRYINTFTYLCKSGYDTVDGLHYTADTYRKIYDFAKLVAG